MYAKYNIIKQSILDNMNYINIQYIYFARYASNSWKL